MPIRNQVFFKDLRIPLLVPSQTLQSIIMFAKYIGTIKKDNASNKMENQRDDYKKVRDIALSLGEEDLNYPFLLAIDKMLELKNLELGLKKGPRIVFEDSKHNYDEHIKRTNVINSHEARSLKRIQKITDAFDKRISEFQDQAELNAPEATPRKSKRGRSGSNF